MPGSPNQKRRTVLSFTFAAQILNIYLKSNYNYIGKILKVVMNVINCRNEMMLLSCYCYDAVPYLSLEWLFSQ